MTDSRHRAKIAIPRGAVHAWLVDLDSVASSPAASAAGLDATEQARAASYVRPQDGARFSASRAVLRLILARYLGCAPGRLEFLVGPSGQPWLAGHEIRFSLARSGGLALVAVSSGPVGADLERLEPRRGLADVAAARFTAPEAACIAAGCAARTSPTRSFYRHWTAKEAYLKAIGIGLAGLREAELVCGPRPAIWLAGRPVAGWPVEIADVAPGYLAAITGPYRRTTWRWLRLGRLAGGVRPAG